METREKIIERNGRLTRQTFLIHRDWIVQDGKNGTSEELVLMHEEEIAKSMQFNIDALTPVWRWGEYVWPLFAIYEGKENDWECWLVNLTTA